jgi:hypothetical protein
LRPALAAIIDLGHLLVRLAPTRLVARLFVLKHMRALVGGPVLLPLLPGELSFCHRLPFERSSLTDWRQRLGEEQPVALIQESLPVAHKPGALTIRDRERLVVETTVHLKTIAHLTDVWLCHQPIVKLVNLARRNGVPLPPVSGKNAWRWPHPGAGRRQTSSVDRSRDPLHPCRQGLP